MGSIELINKFVESNILSSDVDQIIIDLYKLQTTREVRASFFEEIQ